MAGVWDEELRSLWEKYEGEKGESYEAFVTGLVRDKLGVKKRRRHKAPARNFNSMVTKYLKMFRHYNSGKCLYSSDSRRTAQTACQDSRAPTFLFCETHEKIGAPLLGKLNEMSRVSNYKCVYCGDTCQPADSLLCSLHASMPVERRWQAMKIAFKKSL